MNLNILKAEYKFGKISIMEIGTRFCRGLALMLGADVDIMADFTDYLKKLNMEKVEARKRTLAR